MPRKVLIDAGPIVAYLSAADRFHGWAVEQFKRFPSFATCEPVLAEACARLAYYRFDQSRVVELVMRGCLIIDFNVVSHTDRLLQLMRKYAARPMDLADACLVVMTEQNPQSVVVTLDAKDFAVYRRHGRSIIPHLTPPGSR